MAWKSGFLREGASYNQVSCSTLKRGGDLTEVWLCVWLFSYWGSSSPFRPQQGAQGPAGAGSGPQSGPRYSPAGSHEDDPWQIAIGYQYNRDNLLGSPFNTHGVNISLARYFGRWIGVEAQVGVGFLGNTGQTTTPPNLGAKSIFVGAGPRLAIRNRSRFEPWGHLVVGMEHFRFSQTSGLLGSNNALAGVAGGGVDVYLNARLALRVEADAMGSRFFSTTQRSFQVVGGLVLGF
jgi:hypothetical protein